MCPDESARLRFSRELPPQRCPQQRMLRLGDGYQTPVYVHQPTGDRRLPVLYVHGIQSHPGWFVASAAALADRGHTVFQATRRGSGDNTEHRGHADSAERLLDDLAAAGRFILRETGAERFHLLGVSWGGKPAACYAADRRRGGGGQVASLTLVAPGIVPRVGVAAATKLAVALALLVAPRRRFEIPLRDVELFTDNEPMRRYIRGDAFALHRATARFLFASRRLDSYLRRAPAGALAMPTTLLLAKRDRIIDNAATRAVVERLTAHPAVVQEFDAAHVLEFEPDPRPFHAALAAAAARGEPAPLNAAAPDAGTGPVQSR